MTQESTVGVTGDKGYHQGLDLTLWVWARVLGVNPGVTAWGLPAEKGVVEGPRGLLSKPDWFITVDPCRGMHSIHWYSLGRMRTGIAHLSLE